ncbi:MAG: hypothetical protein RRZ30_03790, partial [Bacilli bacterium]
MKEKKNVILTVLLIIIGVLFVSGIGLFAYNRYFKKDNENSNKTDKGKLSYITSYKNIDNMYGKYFIVDNNPHLGIIDINGEIIEDTMYNDIVYLSDGYYVTILDGIYKLKRNGKLVADLYTTKEIKAFKDPNDNNAPYVVIDLEKCTEKDGKSLLNVSIEPLEGTQRRAAYEEKDSKNQTTYVSIIYDSSNGKVIKEINGIIYIENKKNKDIKYYSSYSTSGGYVNYEFLDKDFKSIMNTPNNKYMFFSDECEKSLLDSHINTKKNKRGYYDLELNKEILPAVYDDVLATNSDKSIFLVTSGKKTYLVNNKNEIILDNNYDFIDIFKNNFITIKDYKVEILDEKLNKLDKLTYQLNKDVLFDNTRFAEQEFLCGETMKYSNLIDTVSPNIYKLSTTEGIINLISWNNQAIEALPDKTVAGHLYNEKKHFNFIAKPKDKIINEINIYNLNKDLIYSIKNLAIDSSSKNFNLRANIFKNVIVFEYNLSDSYETKNLYYDLDTKKVITKKQYDSKKEIKQIENTNLSYSIEDNPKNKELKKISIYKDKKLIGTLKDDCYGLYISHIEEKRSDKFIIAENEKHNTDYLYKVN